MTIDEHLAAIEARANAATKGPWERSVSVQSLLVSLSDYSIPGDTDAAFLGGVPVCQHMDERDIEFIAASRTDVPRLTAALRWAVNRLRTLGKTETLAQIEKILQGEE